MDIEKLINILSILLSKKYDLEIQFKIIKS